MSDNLQLPGASEVRRFDPPQIVTHADWGVDAKKRWCAVARLLEDGRYELGETRPVAQRGSLAARMGAPETPGQSIVLGFDFPIGVPRKYAELAGIGNFKDSLLAFGTDPWERFFEVANSADEISLHRPFYPAGAGTRGQHTRQALLDALGLSSAEIFRTCDVAHPERRAANPLFWTLGGAQVGKGALSGWREVVIPAMRGVDALGLWPFDGSLQDLVASRAVVIVETYPAEFYRPLGVRFGVRAENGKWGKRQQHDRMAQAGALVQAAEAISARMSEYLRGEVENGFGSRSDGEDRFDALVGLLGMLHVLLGRIPEGTPQDDDAVVSVEGWILGRPST